MYFGILSELFLYSYFLAKLKQSNIITDLSYDMYLHITKNNVFSAK